MYAESLINDRGQLFHENDDSYQRVNVEPLRPPFDRTDYLALTQDGRIMNVRTGNEVKLSIAFHPLDENEEKMIGGIEDMILYKDIVYILWDGRIYISELFEPDSTIDMLSFQVVFDHLLFRQDKIIINMTTDVNNKMVLAQYDSGRWSVIDHTDREYDEYINELEYFKPLREYREETHQINNYNPSEQYGRRDDIVVVLHQFSTSTELVQCDRGLFTDNEDNLYVILDKKMYAIQLDGLVDAKVGDDKIYALVRNPHAELIIIDINDLHRGRITRDNLERRSLRELDNDIGVMRLIVIDHVVVIMCKNGDLYELDRYVELQLVDIPNEVFSDRYVNTKSAMTRI